jgi:PAS domain S-box-containing protein
MRIGIKVVLLALMTGLLFWFFSSFVDNFFFYQGSELKTRFLNLPPRSIINILFVIFLFLLYGLCIYKEVSSQSKRLQLFNNLIDQSNDFIFLIQSTTSNFIYFNEKACKELFYDKKSLSKKGLIDIDTVVKNKTWDVFLQEVSQKEHLVYESMYTRQDGSTFPVEVNIKSVSQGSNEYLLAVCRDITERKRAQEWYQTIIRTTKDGFFLMDPQGNFLDVNEAYCRLTNFPHDELMQMNIFDLFDSRERTLQYLNRTASLGSDTFDCRHRTRSGQNLLLEASVNYIPTEGGRFFAFLRDITERKQMEEALSAEKERLAVTLRSIGEGMIATDTKGKIVLMNYMAEKLTGWNQEKAAGLPVHEVLYLIDQPTGIRCDNPVDQVLQTGKPVSLPTNTMLLARDGTERLLAASAAPIIDRNHQIIGVVMVFQDKTMERLTEKELLKIEKLSSLGLLAGGIAHDLNNVLAVILGNISLATMTVNGDDMVLQSLAEAEQAGLRAKDLAKQLLTFARGGTPIKKLASISEIIQDSAGFSCAGTQVRCEISSPQHLWPAELDPGQISQVIQNLVINAVQAMPQGGVVHIKAGNVTLKEDNPLSLTPGRYIKITLQDHGVGIWPDHLSKIFDPFFTTKQKGSGLGLATVYSIIKNHDGHITVESAIGKGTTFSIYLPAATKKYVPKREREPELLRGKGKILVMDDEEMIRNNVGSMLKHLGYDAEFAKDGAKALELYAKAKESDHPFDAIIMDLTVPGGMGGRETIQRLLQLDPQAKAIVFSGYADDPIMSNFKEFGFFGFIKKPYTIQDVSEALHKALN